MLLSVPLKESKPCCTAHTDGSASIVFVERDRDTDAAVVCGQLFFACF